MPSHNSVVIVDAVRSPVGKRNGSLASTHPNELLGTVLAPLVDRTGIDPTAVGQVVGGCVGQVGAQASNVTRHAWLTAGLPLEIPATTANVQCGSAQQANTLAHGLVGVGPRRRRRRLRCRGDEHGRRWARRSRVIPTSALPAPATTPSCYEPTTQFEGADRIAATWGLTRDQLDAFGTRSQQYARRAWDEDRFAGQIVPIETVRRAGRRHQASTRRGLARHHARGAGRAQAPTARPTTPSTPPAPRRRSPTAPQPC